MSHLGQRLSALIDGELNHTQRERVLAHLAQCEPCLLEAAALRVLKQRMHALGEATANTALTDRLVALGARGPVPGSIGLSRRRWPVRSIAVAFVTMAGLGVPAAAFMAGGGGQAEPGPGVSPAIEEFMTQHELSTGRRARQRRAGVLLAVQHAATPRAPAPPGGPPACPGWVSPRWTPGHGLLSARPVPAAIRPRSASSPSRCWPGSWPAASW